MSSKSKQREYARRRYEKWLERQAELRARRHRRRIVAGSIVGALAVGCVVWIIIGLVHSGDPVPALASTPTPTAEATAEATPARVDGPTGDVPDPATAEDRTWTATVSTTAGDITLELDGEAAPQAVASFVSLAGDDFFTGTTCHRLTTSGIFVLQCGDPNGNGTGGPDYRFGPVENAPDDDVYPAGTVLMARVPGLEWSMGSQFILVYSDSTIEADSVGGYTVMGHVVGGQDVLQSVANAGIAAGTAQTPAIEVKIKEVGIE